jgi:hypothetical protein
MGTVWGQNTIGSRIDISCVGVSKYHRKRDRYTMGREGTIS